MTGTALTTQDAELIALAVSRALQLARSVSDSEHFDHHQWISLKIKAELVRAEFWRQMLAHVARWGAVSIITALAFALYLGVKAWWALPVK